MNIVEPVSVLYFSVSAPDEPFVNLNLQLLCKCGGWHKDMVHVNSIGAHHRHDAILAALIMLTEDFNDPSRDEHVAWEAILKVLDSLGRVATKSKRRDLCRNCYARKSEADHLLTLCHDAEVSFFFLLLPFLKLYFLDCLLLIDIIDN